MDWGPISEWAAAVAELLAVSVALFLPYYTEHRKEKKKSATCGSPSIISANKLWLVKKTPS
jgi:hypothetical protein